MKSCASLTRFQLTAKHKVATPANWKQGDDVIIAGFGDERGSATEVSWRLEDSQALLADCAAAEMREVFHVEHFVAT